MKFDEFLNLVKVIRMLYGVEAARVFFERNIDNFYFLSISELTKKMNKNNIESSS